MADLPRVGDLELEEDLKFQRGEWIAQRIGWGVMALVVIAALLGLFGGGPLSRATVSDDQGLLVVDYNRFLRHHKADTLRLKLTPDHGANEVHLRVSADYLDALEIQQITPEPVRMTLEEGWQVLVFRVSQPGSPVAVTVHFEPDDFGSLTAQMRLNDQSPIVFEQFIYP